jgi:hypothetical protein
MKVGGTVLEGSIRSTTFFIEKMIGKTVREEGKGTASGILGNSE